MLYYLRSRLSMLKSGERSRQTYSIEHPDELIMLAHYIEKKDAPILLVPRELLRMQGGFMYDADHPFVHALVHGKSSLKEFYDTCRPKNLLDLHRLKHEPHSKSPHSWELPWYHRSIRSPPPGEGNLSPDDGLSFYGPVTERKLKYEYARLNKILTSVNRFGYDPATFGHISGYVLSHRGKICFFIRGGKHRAAVLSYLGWGKIPVIFKQNFPRLIDSTHMSCWPLVRDGSISYEMTERLLNSYLQGQTRRDFLI